VRNRLRRRLRVLLREATLPPGDFLVGVSPAGSASSFDELRQAVTQVVRRCQSQVSP
jgi:ribonuclease P protein component